MALDHETRAAKDHGARATNATTVPIREATRYLVPPLPRPASTEPTSSETPSTGTSNNTAGASEPASATAALKARRRGQARPHWTKGYGARAPRRQSIPIIQGDTA